MTQYFSQASIDEYRECFCLYAPKGYVDSSSHLRYIMRSLGYSPTVHESQTYFNQADGKIDLASFLDILYEHLQKCDPLKEVTTAFKSHDRNGRGLLAAGELQAILMGMGEKIAPEEVDRLFAEVNINNNGMIRYDDLVRIISTPLPDYYLF